MVRGDVTYYSFSELADTMGFAYSTVLGWKKRGLIVPDYITPSGRCYFSEELVGNYLKGKFNQPTSVSVEEENAGIDALADADTN